MQYTVKDHYQVKFPFNGAIKYGIANIFEKPSKKGHVVVSDAVTPERYLVPENILIDIPHGNYLPYSENGPDTDSEYDQYIFEEMQKAEKIAKGLKGKTYVGALFQIGVADGYAAYVVTRVKGSKCDVEWRSFGGGDRYTDHYFGWGRKGMKLADVVRYIDCDRAMKKLFSKKFPRLP